MKYDEFKELVSKAWSEKFNYLCKDVTKNKNEGKYPIFNENKISYIECICETEVLLVFYMLFAKDNRENLDKIEELASLKIKYKKLDHKISLVNRTFMKK